MKNHMLRRLALTALALAIVVATVLGIGAALGVAPIDTPSAVAADSGAQALAAPLFFEPNQGQSRGSAAFLSRSPGASLEMERGRARLLLDAPDEAPHAVTLAWPGGRLANPIADGLLTGVVNYLNGRDETQWVRNVPTYRNVRYEQVYPGIDLVFYGNPQQLEYDFLVAPDADPSVITLAFDGIDDVTIDAASGDLLLHAKGRQIRQHAPIAYQDDPVRMGVDVRYRINDDGTVGLMLGPWNRSRPLIIDPTLDWSTYLGGSGDDWVQGAGINGKGEVMLVGSARVGSSWSLPHTGTAGGGLDAFIARFSATGTHLSTTFLGGSGDDQAVDVAFDAQNNIYITGTTTSLTFPTTANAVMRESASLEVAFRVGIPFITFGEISTDTAPVGDADAYLSKLDPTGSAFLYSTYLSGSPEIGIKLGTKITSPSKYAIQFQFNPGIDQGKSVAVTPDGIAYVAGYTLSDAFPVTDNAFKKELNGLLGASDGFISQIDTRRSGVDSLLFSSYLGGSCDEQATGVALDRQGRVYITGHSGHFLLCGGFTTLPNDVAHRNRIGLQDAFLMKLVLDESPGFVFSTFLGTGANDYGGDVVVDHEGYAYVTYSHVSATAGNPGKLMLSRVSPDGKTESWARTLGSTRATSGGVSRMQAPHALIQYSNGQTSRLFVIRNGTEGTRLHDVFLPTQGSISESAIDAAGSNAVVMAGAASARRVIAAGAMQGSDLETLSPAQGASGGGKDGFAIALRYGSPPVVTAVAIPDGVEGFGFHTDQAATVTRESPGAALVEKDIDWGDGTTTTTTESIQDAVDFLSASHTYADDGEYTGRFCVTEVDSGDAPSCMTFVARVANVAPVVDVAHAHVTVDTPGASFSQDEGGLRLHLSTAAGIIDPGIVDTHTATVKWSDADTAVPVEVGQSSRQVINLSRTFSIAGGSAPAGLSAEICATDDEGASGQCGSFTVALPVADLALTRLGPATVGECSAGDFRVKVTNNGPDVARNTLIRDMLPPSPHMSYLGALAIGGAGDGTSTAAQILRRPQRSSGNGRGVAIEGTAAIVSGTVTAIYERDAATFEWRSVAEFSTNHFDGAAIRGDWAGVARRGFHTSPETIVSGSVQLFHRIGGVWQKTQLLTPPDDEDDAFGTSVAIGEDFLAIGDRYQNNGHGAVYIYRRENDTWSFSTKLTPPGSSHNCGTSTGCPSGFGQSVAMTPNGHVLAVGAPEDRGPFSHTVSGTVVLYRYNGTAWVGDGNSSRGHRIASPVAADTRPQRFGTSLALSEDNGTPLLAIGAPDDRGTSQQASSLRGRASVFRRNGNGNWSHVAEMLPNDPANEQQFGRSVDISGNRVVIGTGGELMGPVSENDVQDRAYLFSVQTNSAAQLLRLRPADTQPGDRFGVSVGISGAEIVAGAPDQGFSGLAYVFSSCGRAEGPGTLQCNVGSLARGESAEFLVTVRFGDGLVPAGSPSTTVTTSADAFSGGIDLTSNLVSTTTTVTAGSCPTLPDVTPPEIIPQIGGPLGNNGWHVGGTTTVSWIVRDAESAITSQTGCELQSVSSDTNGETFTCTATSGGGTSTRSVTLRRDTSAPTVSATVVPFQDEFEDGLYHVTFACADPAVDGAASGVASCPAQTFVFPGGVLNRVVEDRAGNRASINVAIPRVVAGIDQEVQVGANCAAPVQLSAAGSGQDGGGPIDLRWVWNGETIGTGPLVSATLPAGVHEIQLFGTSTTGVTVSDTTRVTVIDDIPPIFTFVPEAIVFDATGEHTAVDVPAALAADACPVVVSTEAPQTFLAGDTTVVFTATDSFGNETLAFTKVTVRPIVDVGISLDESMSIAAGGQAELAMVLTNAGPSRASNIVIRPTLPDGITPIKVQTSESVCVQSGEEEQSCGPISVFAIGAACGFDDDGFACVVPAMDADSTTSFTLTLRAGATVHGQPGLPMTIMSREHDPATANDAATITLNVIRSADVIVSLTGPSAVSAGENSAYTLAVENVGPSSARGVTVSLPLVQLSTTAPLPGFCEVADGPGASHIVCAITELLPGERRQFDPISLRVSPAARGELTSKALAASLDPDPLEDNNSQSISAAVIATADVAIALAPHASPAIAGQPTAWTMTAHNNGPADATDVVMRLLTLAGVDHAAAALPAGCAAVPEDEDTAGYLRCAAERLGPGESRAMPISFEVDPFTRGTVELEAGVFAAETDPVDANNAATGAVAIDVRVDLLLTMSATPKPAVAGRTLRYEMRLTNAGPSGATGVELAQSLPDGVTLDSGGDCSADDMGLSCAVGAMAPDSVVVKPVLVHVDGGRREPLRSLATASLVEDDLDVSTNTVVVETPVRAEVDLRLSVTASPDPAASGQFIHYTIEVANDGPSTATDLALTHRLASGVTSGPLPEGCTMAYPLVTCTSDELAHASSWTMTLTAIPVVGGALSAVTEIAGAEEDPDTSNNRAVTVVQATGPSSGPAGAGDFDGDGDLDVAVADPRADVVKIYFNVDGQLIESARIPVGRGPEALAIGDLDGDGDLDIATVNRQSNDVSILVNDGFAMFVEMQRPGLSGRHPVAITVGDFTGDGALDIIAALKDQDGISLLTRDDSGRWSESAPQAGHAVGPSERPSAVAAGDVDGDGDLDLVFVTRPGTTVAVLTNAGDGRFSVAGEFAMSGSRQREAVSIGDVDGDGDLDMVVAGRAHDVVSLLVNDGEGRFVEASVTMVGRRPEAIALGDFTGDGALDAVTANRNDATVSRLENVGGAFPAAGVTESATASKPIAVIVGDFTGDGVLDLVVISEDGYVPFVMVTQ